MKLIAFDIETWGLKPGYTLQPWRASTKESGILSLAAYDGEKEYVTKFKASKKSISDIIKQFPKDAILCGWNIKFDISFLVAAGFGSKLKKFRFLDGMLLLKRLGYDLHTYALKPTLLKFKELVEYEPNYNSAIEFKTGNPMEVYTKPEQDAMLKYNAQDAVYTRRLIEVLIKQSKPDLIKQSVREGTAAYLFGVAWQQGVTIDRAVLAKCAAETRNRISKFEKLCATVGLSRSIIASPLQLQRYLINNLGMRLTEKTDSGSYSVNAKSLKKLFLNSRGDGKQILRLVIAYKEAMTEQNKFITSAEDCVKESDIIHPDPILSASYTGRLTYNMYQSAKKIKLFKNGASREVGVKLKIGIPMHQIKKSGPIRKIFVAPEDHDLVELDFAAQELRLIACMANEPTMISLFNENKDLHANTGAGIVGLSYDNFLSLKETDKASFDQTRNLGKLTNLALQYRLSARGLYEQWHYKYGLVDKTEVDALAARKAYLSLYSGIPEYWKRNIQFAQIEGYVENMAHRKRYITDWSEENSFKSAQTAINFPIQSTGADQKILALHELNPFLQKNEIKLAWDLHDGLYFYVPRHMMHTEVVHEMLYIMSNLPYESAWGWIPQVQFPVEAKIGERWGELKPL